MHNLFFIFFNFLVHFILFSRTQQLHQHRWLYQVWCLCRLELGRQLEKAKVIDSGVPKTMANSNDEELSYVQVFQNCFGQKLTSSTTPSSSSPTSDQSASVSNKNSGNIVNPSTVLTSPSRRGPRSSSSHLQQAHRTSFGNSSSAQHHQHHPPHGKLK